VKQLSTVDVTELKS